MEQTEKIAYVSPPTGLLEITTIHDAQPRVVVNLDLGIPNFTVFSMKFPLVEDQPKAMSGLIAEAVNVLMDEVASFMMSMDFDQEVIVQLYATVLATFKTMSKESDSSKEQDKIGADPTVKTFEGTFNLPMAFVNETQKRVVTAATKIQRLPKTRHIELTYAPKPKNTVDDAARVIRQYRNRSLKQQPKPLYVIVYDQMGRPTGTLSLNPAFKNKLLSLTTKKGAVDFSAPISFPDEQSMKTRLIVGIPKTISVGDTTYKPEGIATTDMALYHGTQDWLVKFPDGRTEIFPGRPTFRKMRSLNFPVPRNRFNWTTIHQEEEKPKTASRISYADWAHTRDKWVKWYNKYRKHSFSREEKAETMKMFVNAVAPFLDIKPLFTDSWRQRLDRNIDSSRNWLAVVRRELDVYDDAIANSDSPAAERATAGAVMAMHGVMILLNTIMEEQKTVFKEEATNA